MRTCSYSETSKNEKGDVNGCRLPVMPPSRSCILRPIRRISNRHMKTPFTKNLRKRFSAHGMNSRLRFLSISATCVSIWFAVLLEFAQFRSQLSPMSPRTWVFDQWNSASLSLAAWLRARWPHERRPWSPWRSVTHRAHWEQSAELLWGIKAALKE